MWDSSLPSHVFASHLIEQAGLRKDGEDAAMPAQNTSVPTCSTQDQDPRLPGSPSTLHAMPSRPTPAAFTSFVWKTFYYSPGKVTPHPEMTQCRVSKTFHLIARSRGRVIAGSSMEQHSQAFMEMAPRSSHSRRLHTQTKHDVW